MSSFLGYSFLDENTYISYKKYNLTFDFDFFKPPVSYRRKFQFHIVGIKKSASIRVFYFDIPRLSNDMKMVKKWTVNSKKIKFSKILK